MGCEASWSLVVAGFTGHVHREKLNPQALRDRALQRGPASGVETGRAKRVQGCERHRLRAGTVNRLRCKDEDEHETDGEGEDHTTQITDARTQLQLKLASFDAKSPARLCWALGSRTSPMPSAKRNASAYRHAPGEHGLGARSYTTTKYGVLPRSTGSGGGVNGT